jgi:hypothetical protein
MKLSPEYHPTALGCKLPPHQLPYMSQEHNSVGLEPGAALNSVGFAAYRYTKQSHYLT